MQVFGNAVGAEKPKLQFQNLSVWTRGISCWPDVKDRKKAFEGSKRLALNVWGEIFGGHGDEATKGEEA